MPTQYLSINKDVVVKAVKVRAELTKILHLPASEATLMSLETLRGAVSVECN